MFVPLPRRTDHFLDKLAGHRIVQSFHCLILGVFFTNRRVVLNKLTPEDFPSHIRPGQRYVSLWENLSHPQLVTRSSKCTCVLCN